MLESDILRAMKQKRRKRILVSIPQLAYQYRQALEGVLKYAHENSAAMWEMYFDTETVIKRQPPDIKEFQIGGILAYVDDTAFRDAVIASDIPAVLYDPSIALGSIRPPKRKDVILMVHDFREEGRFAARYLLDRHYQHFAYVGEAGGAVPADVCREKGFADELGKLGFTYDVDPLTAKRQRIDPVAERTVFREWLRGLPRRTGLFAVRDARAKTVLAAAVEAKVHVPEHVAVLGFDNDTLLCETCTPQLSSIAADLPSFGYACAQMLDRLMAGYRGGVTVQQPRLQIVTRASTSADAIGDPFVAKSLSWIKEHYAEHPSVESVAEGIGCSLKLLQRRFRKALGCSISAEIRRQKTATAMESLKTTGKKLSQIADECGFSSASHLCACIRTETGLTPNQVRDD